MRRSAARSLKQETSLLTHKWSQSSFSALSSPKERFSYWHIMDNIYADSDMIRKFWLIISTNQCFSQTLPSSRIKKNITMSANLSRVSAVSWPLIQTHQVTMNNGWKDGWKDGWMTLEVLLHQQMKQFLFLSFISVKATHKWEIGLLFKCVQHWQLVPGRWCPRSKLHSKEHRLAISFPFGECWLKSYRWMLGWRFLKLYMDLSSCMDGLNT